MGSSCGGVDVGLDFPESVVVMGGSVLLGFSNKL
jgi:hypothetical protein